MIAPALNTKQAMKYCHVKSFEKFSEICKKHQIKPLWRSGEGNIYRRADFDAIYDRSEKIHDPFYEHANG